MWDWTSYISDIWYKICESGRDMSPSDDFDETQPIPKALGGGEADDEESWKHGKHEESWKHWYQSKLFEESWKHGNQSKVLTSAFPRLSKLWQWKVSTLKGYGLARWSVRIGFQAFQLPAAFSSWNCSQFHSHHRQIKIRTTRGFY